MSACFTRSNASQRGFTMTELITVIVIVGIMGAAVVPRFFERQSFDSRGFYDQTISTLRYAQKTAIAQHRYVCVTFAANSITLTYDSISPSVAHPIAACDTNLSRPTGETYYTVTAPSGVTLSGYADFNFDALGKPNIAATQIISVYGYATTINVEMETGYVH